MFSKLLIRLLQLRLMLFPPVILGSPAHAPEFSDRYQFLVPNDYHPSLVLTINSTSSRFTCGWLSFCRGGSLSRAPLLKISSILFLEYEWPSANCEQPTRINAR